MTKGIMTFSLDIEVIEEMKKMKDKSLLINSYLRTYFGFPGKLIKKEVEHEE